MMAPKGLTKEGCNFPLNIYGRITCFQHFKQLNTLLSYPQYKNKNKIKVEKYKIKTQSNKCL